MRLTRPDGQPFTVFDARVERSSIENTDVRLVSIPGAPIPTFDLVLEVNAGAHSGGFNGMITVRTDVSGEETLELRFRGVVRDADEHEADDAS